MQPVPKDPIAQAQSNWERHDWVAAAAPMAAVTSIVRVHQLLVQRIEASLKPFGLTFARFELLALLSFTKRGELPMSKASALLQVHPTSVTNAVDRLESAGLVRREPHPTDGRSTLVTLTASGRTLARTATTTLNAEVFEDTGFTAGEVSQLIEVLTAFRARTGDIPPVTGPDTPEG